MFVVCKEHSHEPHGANRATSGSGCHRVRTFGLRWAWLAATCASACAFTRYTDQAEELVAPDEHKTELVGLGADRWCSDFGAPELERLVQRAWSDNLELKAAWARVKRANALTDAAAASLWPTLSGNAGADYSEGGALRRDGAAWELSASATYELDIWGRNEHRVIAAEMDALAVEARARGLAMTLTSQVAEAWLDAVTHGQRLRLLDEQVQVSEKMLAITRERMRRGLASALDVTEQQQNVESVREQALVTEGALRASHHRLAVLVGQRPDAEVLASASARALPTVPALEQAAVPLHLMQRRPDVRSAFLALQAADERTAAAVADQLPRLQLSATAGFGSRDIVALFEQLFWSVGAGLSHVVFAGGELRAEVRRSEAVAQEQLFVYANTLLQALLDGYDAVALEDSQRRRVESLERQLRLARSVLDLAQERYRKGTVDYFRVLLGLRELQEVERSLLEARRQQLSYRIQLCRALGGTWVESVEPSIEMED